MSEDAQHKGLIDLMEFIGEYDSYSKILAEVNTQDLLKELENDNDYYRIIAIILLFDRIEELKKVLRREYPALCKFLNETNHIENDYVFQLDPDKFYSIPKYMQEICDFINVHRDKIAEFGN